jgi:YbgC/YbaW family acyl-CoA thioester hydrolase
MTSPHDPAPGITHYHVYPTDCDVFGHVNHATMITLLEHARWALLEPLVSLADMMRGAVWTVVRHVEVSYAWQSVPGDDLVIRSGLVRVGHTSYTVRQSVRHAGTRRLHAAATITFVCLDRQGHPVPVPELWRTMFPLWDDAVDDAFVAPPAAGAAAGAAAAGAPAARAADRPAGS